jgi:hypothetical protein
VQPSARIVLLGASNLTIGLPTVLRATRARLGPGPLEILVAAGHGRSYGQWSRVGIRGLPGILDCGLWARALTPTEIPTYAAVTDIGNDLAYGAAPADLTRWVAGCLDRLRRMGADVVLTLLPAGSIARLWPWQYQLYKALLFPGCRLPFRTAMAQIAEVNMRLAELAQSSGAKLVEPPVEWFALDAIHIAREQRAAAWREIFSRWETTGNAVVDGAGPSRWTCLRMAPEERTLLGVRLQRVQPTAVFADGTVVSLF